MTTLQNFNIATKKIGLTGLTTYLHKIKDLGLNEISRKIVKYEDIVWFSNDKKHLEHTNYIWFQDVKGNIYYLKESLAGLYQRLPQHFARVNDSYIVNLLQPFLEGRINGSNIVVNRKKLTISRTYKENFEKRFNRLYD